MELEIEYCGMWNYLPNATSLVDKLKEQFTFTEKLTSSSGGVFEVKADGDLIFSKKAQDRFPDENEIINALMERGYWLLMTEKIQYTAGFS